MNKTAASGLSFCDVLVIVFIVLKLTGTINWSWWWVFSPLWIPLIVIVVPLLLIMLFKN